MTDPTLFNALMDLALWPACWVLIIVGELR